MAVKKVSQDGVLSDELNSAGASTVVVDFTASWCGPCRTISPVFDNLAKQHPNAVFLKVDVDSCPQTALDHGVSSMPTFVFFRNKQKIDVVQGANAAGLQEKVRRHCGADAPAQADSGEPSPVSGHVDLTSYLQLDQCECLNESGGHPLKAALDDSADTYLESDCDEQLIVSLRYSQPVRLHSLRVLCRSSNAPRTVALFINQPHTVDFDRASSLEPTQRLELSAEQCADGLPVPLRFVKFQNVFNVQLFFSDNHSAEETTRIDRLTMYGTPVASVNMDDFKRVIGKKGEAH